MSTEMIGMQSLAARPLPEPGVLAGSRYLGFGSFTVDLKREELFKDGTRIKLPGKVYHTLVALLERPGEVVSREDLKLKLWPEGTHVNYDANVNTTVNKLRLALGDSPDQPVYVETIPRQGYSFIGRVAPVPIDAAPHKEPVARPSTEPTATAIAPATDATSILMPKSTKWFVAGVVALVLAGMLFGAATVMYFHRIG